MKLEIRNVRIINVRIIYDSHIDFDRLLLCKYDLQLILLDQFTLFKGNKYFYFNKRNNFRISAKCQAIFSLSRNQRGVSIDSSDAIRMPEPAERKDKRGRPWGSAQVVSTP